LALVPLLSVALTVISAFPVFGQWQTVLQQWLVQNLVPDTIARPVLGYITQFSLKAKGLGLAGLSALFVTAIALALTIDGAINRIWRVAKPRPISQRVLIYWAGMTLVPLLLAASLAASGNLIRYSGTIGPGLLKAANSLLNILEFIGFAAALAAMYRFVPHTPVKWSNAVIGGIVAAVAFEIAKRLLAGYLRAVPTYSVIYGTFATVPILLLWLYVVWLIVLFGAVICAYLPSLRAGVKRRGGTPGWRFQCALEILQLLHAARAQQGSGLSHQELASAMRVDALQLTTPLQTLLELDWIGELADEKRADDCRWILLADLPTLDLAPLENRLLWQASSRTLALQRARQSNPLLGRELLP
jgi:membrane protein